MGQSLVGGMILFTHIVVMLCILGQPHEGSCYAAQKDMQMAFHRQEHVKSRLAELDRLRVEHLQQQARQQQQADIKPSGLTDAPST